MGKLSKNLNRGFKRLDIFLEPIGLYMNGKRSGSSCTGGIFSLLFYILTGCYISILIIQMVNHENMTVYENTEVKADLPQFLLQSSENFGMAVSVQIGDSKNMMLPNESVMSLGVYFTNPAGQNEFVKLVKCNTSTLTSLFMDVMSDMVQSFDNLFCPETYINATISNAPSDLVMFFDHCTNSTDITCLDPEKIDETFKKKRILANVFILSYMIDVNNYLNPIQPIVTHQLITLSPGKTFILGTSNIIEIACESSKGYLGQSEKVSSFQIDNFQMQYSFTEIESDPYLVLEISLDGKSSVTYRTYSNILTILAASGGLSRSIFFLFGMIVTMYQRSKFKIRVVSKYFDLSVGISEREKNEKINKSVEIPFITNQISLNDKIDQNEKETLKIKNSELKKIFIERKSPTFSLMTYIREAICCSKHPYIELMKTAKQAYISTFDVVELLRKLSEIDKLKEILLNDQQRKLFSYCSSFGGEDLNSYMEKQKRNQEFHFSYEENIQQKLSRLESYYLAYVGLKKIKENDSLNERLVDFMDPKLRDLFDEIYKILGDNHMSSMFYKLIMNSLKEF